MTSLPPPLQTDPFDVTASSPAEHTDSSSSSAQPRPRRQSSVRWSEDTNTTSRSPMSRGRRLSSSDEITPIRQAEGNAARNYDTATEAPAPQDSGPRPTPGTPKRTSSNPAPDQDEEDILPWYKRVVEKYGSISLENKGSVARDHLALERTFLAWLRTSLAFASIGIAITQLFRLNTSIASRSQSTSAFERRADLPFSPAMGHSIPVEILPYLQSRSVSPHKPLELGPTLLDQLLQLPANPSPNDLRLSTESQTQPYNAPLQSKAFDEEAAAKLRHLGKPLGATFLAISIVVLLVGFHRYFEAQHWIIRGKFPASRGSVALVGFIAAALIVASLVVVLVVAPTSFEKK